MGLTQSLRNRGDEFAISAGKPIRNVSRISAQQVNPDFRGAIQAVPAGQREAALAIGMMPRQAMWRIVLPQAARPALPPYIGQATTLLKNSSLVSVIAVPDLMLTAQSIYSSTYRVVEVMVMAGLLYLAMTSLLQIAQSVLERRLGYYTVK